METGTFSYRLSSRPDPRPSPQRGASPTLSVEPLSNLLSYRDPCPRQSLPTYPHPRLFVPCPLNPSRFPSVNSPLNTLAPSGSTLPRPPTPLVMRLTSYRGLGGWVPVVRVTPPAPSSTSVCTTTTSDVVTPRGPPYRDDSSGTRVGI